MTSPAVDPVSVLNRLLNAEYGNLVHRLGECSPFVTMTAADDGAALRKMLTDAQSHKKRLVDLILGLRGAPNPPALPTEFGGFQYLDLTRLIPQVLASLRTVIKTYESASGTGQPEADALISKILTDHKANLARLEKMHANLGAPARQ